MTHQFKYVFLLITVIAFWGCSKSKQQKCYYTGIPNSFVFLVKKEGNRLSDYDLSNIKISYGTGQNKKYLSDLARGVNEAGINAYDMGILSTRMIGVLSAEQNIKDYFLEFPDGQSHRLYVNYEGPAQSNGCVFVLKEAKYDGVNLNIDSSTAIPHPVYLINYQ